MYESMCSGKELLVRLNGEIDHCTSAMLRAKIESDIAAYDVNHLHLDFSGVTFIDSSGIGMLIGRYKTMHARGGRMSAGGINEGIDRLYRIAGLHRIIPVVEQGGQNAQ